MLRGIDMNNSRKILIANPHRLKDIIKVGDHHYGKMFTMDGYRAFWLSQPLSPFHLIKKENYCRLRDWTKGVQKDNGILGHNPLTLLPYSRKWPFDRKWIGENNLRFTIPFVKTILEKYDCLKVDILWINEFSGHYLTELVKYNKFVLRITDDVPEFRDSPKTFTEIQNELIDKADYVFCTARQLTSCYDFKPSKFYYIPNGVDYDHFHGNTAVQPQDYCKIDSPRIVYVGAICDWFDEKLLYYVAERLPRYNFILVGPRKISLREAKNFRNIFLLGCKGYNDIPCYMKYADVGIIPFKLNKLTKSVSPIKMFEYFAAGLPVVSTRMQEAESLRPPAYFANDRDEFVKFLEEAYKKGKNHPEFFKFAKSNSWYTRYRTIQKIIRLK